MLALIQEYQRTLYLQDQSAQADAQALRLAMKGQTDHTVFLTIFKIILATARLLRVFL